VAFDQESFDEFMFATGDGANWLISDKEEVYASSANTPRTIESSSTSCLPYEAKWYNRSGNSEDPWLSLTDHHTAIGAGDILYGGRGYGGGHASNVLPHHNGANVFIRKSPKESDEGIQESRDETCCGFDLVWIH
jgi:acetylornithine deacetylase/succinyl-diaminopimelate desuccinylase-like protein